MTRELGLNVLDLSIVIVSWNTRDVTLQCLESIEREAGDISLEVIVVDNASTDGSADAIASRFPSVRLIRSTQNLGFAAGNNVALTEARGRMVALINSDVIVLPGCLQAMQRFMDANPRVGLASPRILNNDRTLQPNCMHAPTWRNLACETFALHRVSRHLRWLAGRRIEDWNYDTSRDVDVIVGCFWVARAEALAAVGPLDQSFFMYGEDMDWCSRYRQAGWRIALQPEAEAIHLGGQSSSNAPVRFYVELHRATLRYWRKHHGMLGWVYCVSMTYIHQALRVSGASIVYVLRPSRREQSARKLARSLACLKRLLAVDATVSSNGAPQSERDCASSTEAVIGARNTEKLPPYVLVTPARNEEAVIGLVLESVVNQTHRPLRWVVVDDNSTDGTAEIVRSWAARHPFIELLQAASSSRASFGSKIRAFNAGFSNLTGLRYEFIGNLDADVSFGPEYFAELLARMRDDSSLGLAGGIILEKNRDRFVPQPISLNSVAGAVQMFRRDVFTAIRGFVPLELGGEDSIAEFMTRMNGWSTQTFTDLGVRHHGRVTMGGRNILSTRFRKGIVNHSLGYHPLFQIVIGLYRMRDRPWIAGGALMIIGYCWAAVTRGGREVSPEVVKYVRAEQMRRLRHTEHYGARGRLSKATS